MDGVLGSGGTGAGPSYPENVSSASTTAASFSNMSLHSPASIPNCTVSSTVAATAPLFPCPICGQKFKKEANVGIHIDREHSEGNGYKTYA